MLILHLTAPHLRHPEKWPPTLNDLRGGRALTYLPDVILVHSSTEGELPVCLKYRGNPVGTDPVYEVTLDPGMTEVKYISDRVPPHGSYEAQRVGQIQHALDKFHARNKRLRGLAKTTLFGAPL